MNKFWDGTANLSIFGRRIGYFWLAYYESDTPTGIHERMDAVVNGLKREIGRARMKFGITYPKILWNVLVL